ncbi:MAG: hypothetical protein L6R41_006940 [Letrouitia leprolyta]|nr:MAG: hypothetical protein L6R41_006940 [Letrouitia leprolyta]
MGFFGSLVEGISRAGSWAVDHSGEILQVAKTVGKVAGLVVLNEESEGLEVTEVNPKDPLVGYYDNFVLASEHITARAKEPLNTTHDIQVQGDNIKSAKHTICGLWSQPAVLDKEFRPPLDLYHDLSAWLGAHGVPSSFKGSDGHEKDTALEVSNAIFADAPPANRTSTRAENLVINPSFHVGGTDWSIQGRHAYYTIPLGKGGEDSSWHSAIHFKLTTNEAFRLRSKAEAEEVVKIHHSHHTESSSQDGWIITLQVKWSSALWAGKIQKNFFNIWKSDYQSNLSAKIIATKVNGPNQTLKIGVPSTIVPAQVRAAVLNAGTKANQHTSASKHDSSSNTVTNTPEVYVTDSSLIPGQQLHHNGEEILENGQD